MRLGGNNREEDNMTRDSRVTYDRSAKKRRRRKRKGGRNVKEDRTGGLEMMPRRDCYRHKIQRYHNQSRT
jgi:hypothetical protein